MVLRSVVPPEGEGEREREREREKEGGRERERKRKRERERKKERERERGIYINIIKHVGQRTYICTCIHKLYIIYIYKFSKWYYTIHVP